MYNYSLLYLLTIFLFCFKGYDSIRVYFLRDFSNKLFLIQTAYKRRKPCCGGKCVILVITVSKFRVFFFKYFTQKHAVLIFKRFNLCNNIIILFSGRFVLLLFGKQNFTILQICMIGFFLNSLKGNDYWRTNLLWYIVKNQSRNIFVSLVGLLLNLIKQIYRNRPEKESINFFLLSLPVK